MLLHRRVATALTHLRRTAALACAGLAATALIAVLSAAPAHAATNSFCHYNTSTNQYQCLNDWGNGGAGTTVRLYTINASNENFTEQLVPGRCGGYVSNVTNCPFANAYFDNYYNGWPIYQLKYGSSGLCMGTGTAANGTASLGVMGKCNTPSSGTGGANGTLFVDHNGYMINVYWTNQGDYGNNAACMEPVSGTGASSFVYLDLPTGDGCPNWTSY